MSDETRCYDSSPSEPDATVKVARPRGSGFCIWLTGLSGSGKTTTALYTRDFLARHGIPVTVLDGDVVRRLSPELGFTREDRERNVLTVASMAAEIVRRGEIVICALISPYHEVRARARAIVGTDRFLEAFVDTPQEVCERRDVKGLYRRARQGKVSQMTGVDDPYEPPSQPDLILKTVDTTVEENVQLLVRVLADRGLLTGIGEGPL